MSRFPYLTNNDKSFDATWAWAKRLVDILNKAFASVGGTAPTGTLVATMLAEEPAGWLFCNGQEVAYADYPDLALALGFTTERFTLPDYRNRIFMGAGATVALGAVAGATSVGLSVDNLPVHTHAVTDPGHTHAVTDPGHTHAVTDPGHTHTDGAVAGTTGTAGAAANTTVGNTGSSVTNLTVNSAPTGVTNNSAPTGVTVGNTGSGVAVNILPPVVGVNIMVKA